jgi:hypothetical protein
VPLPTGIAGSVRPVIAGSGSRMVNAAHTRMLKPITPTSSFISFSNLP